MLRGQDYVREIQKFTTSQYWNAGARITAGVMVPTLILAQQGWLATGMPFLWGALFVSLTDTPGPIHHRRNGMLAGMAFNALTVLLTSFTRDYQVLLLAQVILLSFFYSSARCVRCAGQRCRYAGAGYHGAEPGTSPRLPEWFERHGTYSRRWFVVYRLQSYALQASPLPAGRAGYWRKSYRNGGLYTRTRRFL